jgi:uncharacterized repeat protein (TIGR02543 family)
MPANAVTVTATYKDAPATTYALTVQNGTGSGNYAAGATVTITANAAPSGKVFDQWTGDISGIANVNLASTTFTMGTANATVTATYKDASPTQYTLTVNSGTGSGNYTSGTVVNISANAPPGGQVFDRWTGNTSGIADVNSASTTLTMGSANTTVTATYKTQSPTTFTVTFNADGGTPTPAPQTVTAGEKATKPATDPTKDGYVFIGWFNGTTEWNFSTMTVNTNLTLTAKWDVGTAIEPVATPEVKVWSSGGILTIESESAPIRRVGIYSISGNQLYKADFNDSYVTISGLPKGILMIMVETETGSIMKKIII